MRISAKESVGHKFGRALVLSVYRINGRTKAHCMCDCGKEFDSRVENLRSGETKSCGCLNKELSDQRRYKHGYFEHPIYSVWEHVKGRCYNTNNSNYYLYGARGIRVCDEWKDNPQSFIEWSLKNGYKKGLQLDRINNDGNYEPENCRYTTPRINTNNRRNTIFITYNNKTLPLSEWAELLNISASTLRNRYKQNKMPIEDLLSITKLKAGRKCIRSKSTRY